MSENKKLNELTKGIFRENPTFILVLGMCPTLAVTTQVINALSMGAGVLFVLLFSNIIISLLKDIIPNSVRIPCYIVVIAAFVTIVEMVFHAFIPAVYEALGVYLPLIVVNCIILGRAEAFANKNTVVDSALDAIGMGIGFTLALTLIALIRESIGAGTITLINTVITVPWFNKWPVRVMTLAAGALLLMGYLKAFFTWLPDYRKRKAAEKEVQA